MVTELLSSYRGAHLEESYCKISNTSDTHCFHHIWTKLGWVYDIITWPILEKWVGSGFPGKKRQNGGVISKKWAGMSDLVTLLWTFHQRHWGTILYSLRYLRQLSSCITLGKVNFCLFLWKIKPTVKISQGWGARQLWELSLLGR